MLIAEIEGQFTICKRFFGLQLNDHLSSRKKTIINFPSTPFSALLISDYLLLHTSQKMRRCACSFLFRREREGNQAQSSTIKFIKLDAINQTKFAIKQIVKKQGERHAAENNIKFSVRFSPDRY